MLISYCFVSSSPSLQMLYTVIGSFLCCSAELIAKMWEVRELPLRFVQDVKVPPRYVGLGSALLSHNPYFVPMTPQTAENLPRCAPVAFNPWVNAVPITFPNQLTL
jgi:hypothetical protein